MSAHPHTRFVKNKIKTIELIDSLIKAQEKQIISQSKLSKKTKENLDKSDLRNYI